VEICATQLNISSYMEIYVQPSYTYIGVRGKPKKNKEKNDCLTKWKGKLDKLELPDLGLKHSDLGLELCVLGLELPDLGQKLSVFGLELCDLRIKLCALGLKLSVLGIKLSFLGIKVCVQGIKLSCLIIKVPNLEFGDFSFNEKKNDINEKNR
jgi:hypothetical protein